MQEKELYLLLDVIKNNGNIKKLVREGISYKMIAELTNEAILKNLVIYNNDVIELSELGNLTFEKIRDNYKKTNKEEWIQEEERSKIPKIDKGFIFLPDQNELFF